MTDQIDAWFVGAAVILREHGFEALADEITTMWTASRATVHGQATRIMELEAERENLHRALNPDPHMDDRLTPTMTASEAAVYADALISAGWVRGPVEQTAASVDRRVLLDALLTADDDYRSGYRTTAYLTHLADRLLARYDIRERGEAQPAEQQAPQRVSAHRLDRIGSVVVGVLLPYDESEGERVRDDDGVVWWVEADTVLPAPVERGEAS